MPHENQLWRSLRPSRNITARVTLAAAIAMGLLTVALAFVAQQALRAELEERVQRELQSYALATSERFQAGVAGELRAHEKAATRLGVANPRATTEERRAALDALLTQRVAWAGFADLSGRILAGSEGMLENSNVSNRAWFRNGLTSPYRDPNSHKLPELAESGLDGFRLVAFGLPVRDASGTAVGVLGIEQILSFDSSYSGIPRDAVERGIDATFYLPPPQGIWLLGSTGNAGFRYDKPPITGGKERGVGREDASGRDVLVAFVSQPSGNPPHLVAVRQPLELAFAPARHLRNRILQWGFALSLLLVVPSHLAGRRITRKLRALTIVAGRIEEGDKLTILPVFKPNDQLAETSEALRTMVDAVRRPPGEVDNSSGVFVAPPGSTIRRGSGP